MTLARTPFDGSSVPFTIGLRPLDTAEWIETDDRLADHLAQKDALYASAFEKVFAAEADTIEAQGEVLSMLVEHLPTRFPDLYRRHGDAIEVVPAGRSVALDAELAAPLIAASRLVQEDLVLMRKGADGWRLAAAALCFPSSWSLAEKFGRPLDEIHAPVPGFAAGTRPAALIARIFDNLSPAQPVERLNWSLQEDDRLHHPRSKGERDAGIRPSAGGLLGDDLMAGTFIRVERQTLRRLPLSGDILFTIRIHLDPLRRLATHPQAERLAASLADQLDGLDPVQLAYKGIAENRDALVSVLRNMTQGYPA
ncbi:MAG: heme-dependent oxidative N-demethylase family protein [Rhizobiaceae bacterium]